MKSTAVCSSAWSCDDEVEHLRLDRRVEPGRRLVEDQQRGILRQRHRDHDPLLHPAGELVWVAAHARSRDPRSALVRVRRARARWPRLRADSEHGERLGDLVADAEARVQGCSGVLVHHRDGSRVVVAESTRAEGEDVAPCDRDRAARHPPVAWQVANDPERRRRLAAPGLAHEPVRLSALDRERDAAEHRPVDAANAVGEREVRDVERRNGRLDAHRSYTSRTPSATRFTAMTRLAIASAGNSVIHQYGSISVQYWLICAAQAGEGGATPKPRNPSVAMAKIA